MLQDGNWEHNKFWVFCYCHFLWGPVPCKNSATVCCLSRYHKWTGGGMIGRISPPSLIAMPALPGEMYARLLVHKCLQMKAVLPIPCVHVPCHSTHPWYCLTWPGLSLYAQEREGQTDTSTQRSSNGFCSFQNVYSMEWPLTGGRRSMLWYDITLVHT